MPITNTKYTKTIFFKHSGLVTFYDIQPGNGAGLFSKWTKPEVNK